MKVTNVSLTATVQDIKEFFSFSGDIEHVEMQRFVKPDLLGHPFSFHVHTIVILISLFLFTLAAVMSGLKLHMSLSKMHKAQKLHFFFRSVPGGLSMIQWSSYNTSVYDFSLLGCN